jgi:endoribonuclease Dicer
LIAALLLHWTVEREIEDRASGKPRRIAFFLVDKVALVFQQHAVLECNLDYAIEKFCGEMMWDKMSMDHWHRTLDENMVIVCTAEILYQCLCHSYVRMQEINLLVFDEAHHTKKNHPYARIIKDFYTEVNPDQKPRILGMTASPVDSKTDPEKAAAQLEALLHSRIATIDDAATLQKTVCRPKKESIVQYERLPVPYETSLQVSLNQLIGSHDQFHRLRVFCRRATSELGPWVADRCWQLKFNEEDAEKLEANEERFLITWNDPKILPQRLQNLRDARELVKSYSFPEVRLDRTHLSSKVIDLVKILRQKFGTNEPSRKCIIFVEQRNTAIMLLDLLGRPSVGISGLKAGMLVCTCPLSNRRTK